VPALQRWAQPSPRWQRRSPVMLWQPAAGRGRAPWPGCSHASWPGCPRCSPLPQRAPANGAGVARWMRVGISAHGPTSVSQAGEGSTLESGQMSVHLRQPHTLPLPTALAQGIPPGSACGRTEVEGVELLPSSWDQGQGKGQLIPPGWSRTHQPGLPPQPLGGAVTLPL